MGCLANLGPMGARGTTSRDESRAVAVVSGAAPAVSAGILLWRRERVTGSGHVEVLLGHMGGPFWSRKDDGAWSIPKGMVEAGESPIAAARREFTEELGFPIPPGELIDLGEVRQSSKKIVRAWALELDSAIHLDLDAIVSNTFEIEWPPRSGRMQSFPEIDRVAWFDLGTARRKAVSAQSVLFDAVTAHADLH